MMSARTLYASLSLRSQQKFREKSPTNYWNFKTGYFRKAK